MSFEVYSKAHATFQQIRQDPHTANEVMTEYLNFVFKNQQLSFRDSSVDVSSHTALNSLNGSCVSTSGKKYFFKFHTEENEVLDLSVNEMYQANILIEQGWDIIAPYASSSIAGSQCELYEWISHPTVYSYLANLEKEFLRTGKLNEVESKKVLTLISRSIRKSTQLILKTLEVEDCRLSGSLIHRLFGLRLNPVLDELPRIDQFYGPSCKIKLNSEEISFYDFSKLQWIVNGTKIPWTIAQLITDSKNLLSLEHSNGMASVVAHGDEHFANQFLMDDNIVFFDPAFAGRMPALLSMVKATTHNVIAHPFWLYEPQEIEDQLSFIATRLGNTLVVEHNWNQFKRSPLRLKIAQLYIKEAWAPLIKQLKDQNALPKWWIDYVRCAIFCSPFLAKNLSDTKQFPPYRPLFNFASLLDALVSMEEYLKRIE